MEWKDEEQGFLANSMCCVFEGLLGARLPSSSALIPYPPHCEPTVSQAHARPFLHSTNIP